MADSVDSYVDSNRERFLAELFDFLRIPSISTEPEHKADIERAARFTADALTGAGFKFRNPNVKGTCGCGESFIM